MKNFITLLAVLSLLFNVAIAKDKKDNGKKISTQKVKDAVKASSNDDLKKIYKKYSIANKAYKESDLDKDGKKPLKKVKVDLFKIVIEMLLKEDSKIDLYKDE